ncbi:MAG: VWA domain-containing protein [Thermoanaerobaculia bacterium]
MTLRALGLTLLLSGWPAAFAVEPPAAPPAPSAPADASALSTGDTFLADVAPLATAAEVAAYKALTRDYQRQAFARKFWEVRDPFPQTPRNELEERWSARLGLARERFPAPGDERFRITLFNGEPARRIPLRCAEILRAGEIWIFGATDRIPHGFALVFVTNGVNESGPHHLWSPKSGYGELLTFAIEPTADAIGELNERIPRDCPRGEEILGGLTGASDWEELARQYDVVPHPNPEWVRTFLSYSTDLPAGARPLAAEVAIHFPGRNQSRTIVDASVIVSAQDLRDAAGASPGPDSPTAAPQTPGAEGAALLLDGEVLRDGELFDHFRYRFDLSAENLQNATTLPFSARRFLRPGTYTLVVRLQDTASGSAFRSEMPLEVPAPGSLESAETPGTTGTRGTTGTVAANAPPATTAGSGGNVAVAGGGPASGAKEAAEPSLRLIAPTSQLVLGRVRVEADVRGIEPARVDFELDGKPFLSKRRAPFSVELDLGRSPRFRRLTASAFDAAGALVAADEVLLNGGPHRFSLRLTEPTRTPPAGQPLETRAEVDLPEGEELDRVEFFLNDTLLATLYQPPFAVSLVTPPLNGVTYLRAVAYLAGGLSAEDVRLLGAGQDGGTVDVDFVELFATVLDRRGRPVNDLKAEDFRVLEDGKEQVVRRFDQVDSLPIHAGVMIDTSASMLEELSDAETAADRFFREVLTPADRAAVITFADAPRLAVRFTGNLEVLAGGLAGLKAEGETRFFDSLAFALHYFSGVRGKRALILLTDGDDSKSTFRFEEVLDFARRTGVTIYSIGLNVPTNPVDAGVHLDQLARETGGRSFRIRRANELSGVYETIRQELRSQYLVAYQSSRLDGSVAYREIALDVLRPGVTARTIRGYYP